MKFNKNSNAKIIALALTGCILAGTASGFTVFFLTREKPNDKNNDNTTTNPIVSESFTPTPTPFDKPALSGDNFFEVVESISKSNEEKGLYIDPTYISSALFITNIDLFTEEDLKKIYSTGDFNIIEELSNTFKYNSEVSTHNIKGKSFISRTNLTYDEEDKAIIKALEDEFNNTYSGELSEDEFLDSFDYTHDFILGSEPMVTSEGTLGLNSMTSGGYLLAESIWMMSTDIYNLSNYTNDYIRKSIVTAQLETVNSQRILGSILNHEVLNCLEGNQKKLERK